jgi:hypothetical protein
MGRDNDVAPDGAPWGAGSSGGPLIVLRPGGIQGNDILPSDAASESLPRPLQIAYFAAKKCVFMQKLA